MIGCNPAGPEPGRDSFATIEEHFADPPPEYRPAPFWIWHAVVTEELMYFHVAGDMVFQHHGFPDNPWRFKYAPTIQPAVEDYNLLDYGIFKAFNVSVVF